MATTTDASGQRSRELLDDERLDDVSDLHVLIARDADAALEALLHLGRVVLEAAKRADLAFVNDAAVANEAYGSRTRDDAVRDHAAPDRPDLRNLERLANLGVPAGDFLLDGVEEARHGFLDLVRERVDDGVETDVDAFVVGELLGLLLGLHVEPADDGVRRRGEEDVVHRDRADSGVQDADLHLLGGELAERLDENLLGAVHVGLSFAVNGVGDDGTGDVNVYYFGSGAYTESSDNVDFTQNFNLSQTLSQTPEPASVTLMFTGIPFILFLARRRSV